MGQASARPRLATAMLIVFALLCTHNVVLAVRNQIIFDKWHRTQKQLPSLAAIADATKNEHTRRLLGFYYILRERIGGASIEIGAPLSKLEWWFHFAATLEVVDGAPIAISNTAFAELKKRATLSRTVRIPPRDDHRVHLIVGDKTERYVLFRMNKRGIKDWILMPRRLLP